MKFWLIENGEKSGPHESFAVRERIEQGELKAEDLCWHQNATSWMPLKEVETFESYFREEVAEEEDQPPMIPESAKLQAEQIRSEVERQKAKAPALHMVRRYFARAHDLTLYMAFIFIVFQEKTLDTLLGESIWPYLGMGLAYVILDGMMTHFWGASPGKWLLGLRVTNSSGQCIPLTPSLVRSMRVWILGFGMWAMWLLALPLSWFLARRFGYFLWDLPQRYRVVVKPFSGLNVVGYMVSLFIISAAMNAFIDPAVIERMHEQSGFNEMLEKLDQ
ncbi:RDD family protein [Rubritalea marina]|uniref:RDD family protein n=1 Tax=Rubritalea marina TaxID=361055 RepID=UPI0003736617|nr:RDD family protein [Rubritalea marina]